MRVENVLVMEILTGEGGEPTTICQKVGRSVGRRKGEWAVSLGPGTTLRMPLQKRVKGQRGTYGR